MVWKARVVRQDDDKGTERIMNDRWSRSCDKFCPMMTQSISFNERFFNWQLRHVRTLSKYFKLVLPSGQK